MQVTDTPVDAHHQHPFTIAIDVGGTGLKADVLDKDGVAVAGRVRVPTTYPMPPHELVSTLTKLVAKLPEGDRVSCGFPGMVRKGQVLSAPHFVLAKGPGTRTDPKLFVGLVGLRPGEGPHQVHRQAVPGRQRR